MNNWSIVFESTHLHKVEIVKDVLFDRGLEPVIVNKKDTAYNIFGQYEVHVAPEHAVRAIRIIENDIKFK
ncbi:MAG: hypothetical protein DRI71_01200 [Bacteroidetes bacterium]|nr:MAG: hypothetical protein DRI71_01200 [Bacteroidota bacterium]